MARQLSRLTDKQLARLTPLVGEEVVDAVALSARIDRRNQGRGRQESLVARLLRESVEDEAGMQQLQVGGREGGREPPGRSQLTDLLLVSEGLRIPSAANKLLAMCSMLWRTLPLSAYASSPMPPCPCAQAAIDSVRTGQGVIADPVLERPLQLWMDAPPSGDPEATTQVFSLAQASGADLQQMRQLLRQAQQLEAAPAAADEQEGDSSSSNGSSSAAPASGGPAGQLRPTAKARAASKQLRKLLQPLAAAHVGDGEAEE